MAPHATKPDRPLHSVSKGGGRAYVSFPQRWVRSSALSAGSQQSTGSKDQQNMLSFRTVLLPIVVLGAISACVQLTLQETCSWLTTPDPGVGSSANYRACINAVRAYVCKYVVCPTFRGEYVPATLIEERCPGNEATCRSKSQLWLGPVQDASNSQKLQQLGVTHIVTVVRSCDVSKEAD